MAFTVLALAGALIAACDQTVPMTSKRLFEISKPATVMVLDDITATVVVPEAEIDQTKLDALENQAIDLVLAGQLADDQNAISAWMLGQLLNNLAAYLVPSSTTRQTDVKYEGQGSGLIVTSDGYVITNAHVAAPSQDEVKSDIAQFGLTQFVKQDVADFVKSAGGNATNDQIQKITAGMMTFYSQHVQVKNLQTALSVQMGAAIPGVVTGNKSIPAGDAAKVAGEQIPGKDVAIIKIDKTNLPTVPLGDDANVNPGDTLYVLGYPGDATFHPLLADQSQVEPSMTVGHMSARKTMQGGWSVIQTDAAITHGSSGGPVFDSNGDVVGIATFGTVDSSGNLVQGFNFVVPMTVIKEFINQAGVHPAQSLVTTKYDDAVALYDKGWYSDSLAEFQEVNALSPGHPYVQDYITQSQTMISEGKDRSYEKFYPFLLIGLPLLLVLVGGGVAFAVMKGGSGRTAMAPAGPSIPVPAPAPAPVPVAAAAAPVLVAAPATAPPVNGSETAPVAPVTGSFCSKCGNPVVGKAFCDKCGKKVSSRVSSDS